MVQQNSDFWVRYRQIYNSPEQRLKRRVGRTMIACYGLIGLPLCLVLMKIGFSMGWPVGLVSPIAIAVAYPISAGVGYYLSKKTQPNGG
jgi:hypothetical protein